MCWQIYYDAEVFKGKKDKKSQEAQEVIMWMANRKKKKIYLKQGSDAMTINQTVKGVRK